MNDGRKKVALVYDAVFPYVKGGAEKRFHELGKQLTRDGYDVHVYGMKFWDGPATIKRFGMTLHGIGKARPLYTKSGRRSMTQPIWFGLSCLKLLGEDFDYIDCCGFPYFSLFVCRLAAAIKRKRLVSTWHEVWGKGYWREYLGVLGNIGFAVEWLAARLPHTIVAVSDHTAQALTRKLGVSARNVIVIENGVHISDIAKVPAAPLKSDVIYVGRLVDYKNIDVLLRAISIVKTGLPRIRLAIVGDGPKRAALEKLATQLDVSKQVTFTGFYDDHNDVLAAMKSSKVFVLPSSREGFGLVAIEANAAGIPVITVNAANNAAKTFVDSTNGVVTDLDPTAIARAIEDMLQGSITPQQCTAAARRYDWAELTGKLEAVWQQKQ